MLKDTIISVGQSSLKGSASVNGTGIQSIAISEVATTIDSRNSIHVETSHCGVVGQHCSEVYH